MANIRFDDPENLAEQSRIFISVMTNMELLDYARRYYERKGDDSSIRRAEVIRKYYKQVLRDYVYIVRSIIPSEIIDDHIKLHCERINKLKIE